MHLKKIPIEDYQSGYYILVKNYYAKIEEAEKLSQQATDLEGEIKKYLFDALGYQQKEVKNNIKAIGILQTISYSLLEK